MNNVVSYITLLMSNTLQRNITARLYHDTTFFYKYISIRNDFSPILQSITIQMNLCNTVMPHNNLLKKLRFFGRISFFTPTNVHHFYRTHSIFQVLSDLTWFAIYYSCCHNLQQCHSGLTLSSVRLNKTKSRSVSLFAVLLTSA